jgi:hypothetical protein
MSKRKIGISAIFTIGFYSGTLTKNLGMDKNFTFAEKASSPQTGRK